MILLNMSKCYVTFHDYARFLKMGQVFLKGATSYTSLYRMKPAKKPLQWDQGFISANLHLLSLFLGVITHFDAYNVEVTFSNFYVVPHFCPQIRTCSPKPKLQTQSSFIYADENFHFFSYLLKLNYMNLFQIVPCRLKSALSSLNVLSYDTFVKISVWRFILLCHRKQHLIKLRCQ